MITIYDRYETAFTYNGFGILEVYDDVVEEELNGIFKFTFKYPFTARLADKVTVGSMLRVDTPEGAEPFRIWTVKNADGTLEVTAYHVTFDLYYQIIEDKNLVTLGGQAALTRLLEDTPFTALSDVTTTASARVVRKTVQQAIFSDDENSFLTRWGGEFVRDGFTLNAKNFRGRTFAQNPVAIRYGKNLVSYESEIDESTYYNRIMPVGFDGLLLPEKYVDRPGIDLNDIRVKIVEYGDIKAIADAENPQEDELPLAEAEQAMRDKAIAEFADGLYDPKVNHRVSFVDLSSTVEYENIAVLERRYLGDEVKVINQDGVDVIARVISYQYSPTTKEYIQIELGNFQEKPMNLVAKIDIVSKSLDEYSQKQITIDQVTDILTSALGGYVKEVNGELFALDTDDPMTAQYVARWNYEGLGFSSTGVNGPYETAIMRNGIIIGKYIEANSITTNQLSSEVGQNLVLSSNTSIRFVSNNSATLDEDGFTIEDTVSPNKTTLKPDGMEVKNKSTDMDLLVVTPDGTYIPTLTADSIQSDSIIRAVGNLSKRTITYYLAPAATGDGSGRDEYNKADNFQTALTNATNGGLVLKNVDIIIDVAPGKYNGLWRIMGYMGLGSIQVLFNPGTYLNGHIDIYDCTCKVSLTAGATGDFTLTKGGLVNGITLLNASNVFIERPVIIHPVATGYPIYLENSNLVISSYDIAGDPNVSPVRAIYADLNSRVYAMFGKGNTQNGAFSSLRGSIFTAGYGIPMPAATANPDCNDVTGTYFAKETARTISSAVVPAITWQSVSKTFTADLYRINQSTMWRTNGEMAQGKSPNSGESYKGYASWGNAIKEYLESNGGYRNITSIVLSVTRGGWGYGDDALKITSPSTKTMSVQSRYTTATTDLLGSALQTYIETSADLILSTSTLLTDDYANFTKVTMKIVCEKRV